MCLLISGAQSLGFPPNTKPAVTESMQESVRRLDPESLKKDDQWKALTPALDAHEDMAAEVSRELQVAVGAHRQCGMMSFRDGCGLVPGGPRWS